MSWILKDKKLAAREKEDISSRRNRSDYTAAFKKGLFMELQTPPGLLKVYIG